MVDSDASERVGDRGDQPPRVFVSYSEDSPAHAKRVLELAQWLRSHGVDATLDQFEDSPKEGWPGWFDRQIREVEFVLVVATPTYLRRCERDQPRANASGSRVGFGSHLTLQELRELGGRDRKFIPVLFGHDAIVESVPLPLRGATCYRLPEQRDDLYRRLTGQPKVRRAPLGVLKTFDDETLLDSEDPPYAAEAAARGRASLDEQHADDSLHAIADAGLLDESARDRTRSQPARSPERRRAPRRAAQLLGVLASALALLSLGSYLAQRRAEPEPSCRVQLSGPEGELLRGIARVNLELPSGHLLEVVIEDGQTLRFACPPKRVHAQAHVYLDPSMAAEHGQPQLSASEVLQIDGRVVLPGRDEVGGEVIQTQLVTVIPLRVVPAQPSVGPP